jgi:hypothetical protein
MTSLDQKLNLFYGKNELKHANLCIAQSLDFGQIRSTMKYWQHKGQGLKKNKQNQKYQQLDFLNECKKL